MSACSAATGSAAAAASQAWSTRSVWPVSASSEERLDGSGAQVARIEPGESGRTLGGVVDPAAVRARGVGAQLRPRPAPRSAAVVGSSAPIEPIAALACAASTAWVTRPMGPAALGVAVAQAAPHGRLAQRARVDTRRAAARRPTRAPARRVRAPAPRGSSVATDSSSSASGGSSQLVDVERIPHAAPPAAPPPSCTRGRRRTSCQAMPTEHDEPLGAADPLRRRHLGPEPLSPGAVRRDDAPVVVDRQRSERRLRRRGGAAGDRRRGGRPARRPRTLTVHYLRAPAAGPVEIEVTVERSGRTVTNVSARLSQDGRLMALALAAAGASTVTPRCPSTRRPGCRSRDDGSALPLPEQIAARRGRPRPRRARCGPTTTCAGRSATCRSSPVRPADASGPVRRLAPPGRGRADRRGRARRDVRRLAAADLLPGRPSARRAHDRPDDPLPGAARGPAATTASSCSTARSRRTATWWSTVASWTATDGCWPSPVSWRSWRERRLGPGGRSGSVARLAAPRILIVSLWTIDPEVCGPCSPRRRTPRRSWSTWPTRPSTSTIPAWRPRCPSSRSG